MTQRWHTPALQLRNNLNPARAKHLAPPRQDAHSVTISPKSPCDPGKRRAKGNEDRASLKRKLSGPPGADLDEYRNPRTSWNLLSGLAFEPCSGRG